MSWGEEQQKEIETIRERKITVKLSDADCDRLARKCGEHRPRPDRSLITATFFVIVIKKSSFPNIFTNMY